jgi:hypothetical protein
LAHTHTVTAVGAARMIPARAWHRMRTGTAGEQWIVSGGRLQNWQQRAGAALYNPAAPLSLADSTCARALTAERCARRQNQA